MDQENGCNSAAHYRLNRSWGWGWGWGSCARIPGSCNAAAWGHLARVGKAGFKAGAGLAIDGRHLVPGAGQVVGGGYADDAATEDKGSHGVATAGRKRSTRRVQKAMLTGRLVSSKS